MVCVDSPSVKLAPMIWEEHGLDVHKRVNGRKRQLIVDTQGRLWLANVHGAHEPDGRGAIPLIASLLWRAGERLEKVYGDQAYNGVFAGALSNWSIDFEKASLPASAQGFISIAKRWVVERTIAWTNFSVGWSKITSIQYLLR